MEMKKEVAEKSGIIAYKVIVNTPIAIGKKIDGDVYFKVPDLGSEIILDRTSAVIKMLHDNIWSDAKIDNFVDSIRLLEEMERNKNIKISATNVNGVWLEGKVILEAEKDETAWKTQRVVIA